MGAGTAGIKSDPGDIFQSWFDDLKAELDVYRSYDLGVNSFITKPVTLAGLVEVVSTLGKYWFEIVELPSE
jgi:hypothetical protein